MSTRGPVARRTLLMGAAALLAAAACTPADAATTGTPKARGWSTEQVHNAAVIATVGRQMHVPRKGRQIALATAMQESSLHNMTGGDRDSVGLFQQRASWGSYSARHNPAVSARKFYSALLRVHGWRVMSVTRAAQAVQRSAFPTAYAKWAGPASALLTQVER